MNNAATTTVASSELQTGMTVHADCGMRVLLDQPIDAYPGSGGLTTYGSDGLLLNREDVPARQVPWSFTGRPGGQHRWRVQGNDLVSWEVER